MVERPLLSTPFLYMTLFRSVSVAIGVETAGVDAVLAAAGSISGTVTDEAGAPLQGAVARAYDSSEALFGTTSTGGDGTYLPGGLGA